MKKLLFTLVFAFSFLFTSSISAQSYSTAAGAKFLWGLNGTYKKEMKESLYIDVYAGIGFGSNYSSINGGAALEWHKPIESIENLYWYYGGGAYFATYSWNSGFGSNSSSFDLGINAVIGLDYAFEEIPLNISVDWMPGFNLIGSSGFYGRTGGLAARYILNRN